MSRIVHSKLNRAAAVALGAADAGTPADGAGFVADAMPASLGGWISTREPLASGTARGAAVAATARPAVAASVASSTVSLSGTVFSDNNDDGLVDGDDKGDAGVSVQLIEAGVLVATTTTAADGSYSFTGEAPGTYFVRVVLPSSPAGAVFSPLGSNTPPQPTGGAVTAKNNLLTNGSFESSSFTTAAGYVGWTSSVNTASTPYGSGPGKGPEIALTNGSKALAIDPSGGTNPYAGTVAADNANANYAGGSGTQAAFFVDDGAIETLSQSVMLTGGQIYEVGFDLNETSPGAGNAGFFQLQASIGGTVITTAGSTSGTKLTVGAWTHFADLYTPSTTGTYTLTFSYASGVPGSTLTSKDVLVDDVYIVPGQSTTTLTTTSEVDANGNTTPVTLTAGQSVGNESAGIYLPPATINGTVFNDTNGNGAKDAGDTAAAGITVNLARSGTIIATTTTAADGSYSFTDQAAGTYTVTIAAPGADKFSSPGNSKTLTDSTVTTVGTQVVTVANGGTATVNAGLYLAPSIVGTVFTDTNGDGSEQASEAGLGGQTVELFNTVGVLLLTTVTAANGSYSFTGEAPGAYTVQVIGAAGDAFSPNGTSATLGNSAVSATGASGTLTLTSGATVTVDAGEYAPAAVSGTVFADANADGVEQGGEAGLAGQTVELLNGAGAIVATTTTAANGGYSFTGRAPGNYSVAVVGAAGDSFSPKGTSTSLPDSGVSATGASSGFTLVSGGAVSVNAGEYAPATVTGTVFTDANGDGAEQASEAGLAGQTVELLNAAGTVISTTTTAANGSYGFAGAMPGSYSVKVVAANGDTFSPMGSSATLPDSGVSAAGASGVFTLSSGGTAAVNAGEFAPSSVSGTVFTDRNADGVEQATDTAVAGATVNLLGAGGTVIATTTTSASGTYSFGGLTPGADTVQVIAPAGDAFSPVGTSTSRLDSTVGSNGTEAVAVVSGSASTVNAGVYAPVAITGTVFADANGDGSKQAGDAGLAGQTVELIGAGGTVLATTTTAANGSYGFSGQMPGTYSVQVVAAAGDSFSPMGSSTTLTNSKVSATGLSASVTLTSGGGAVINAGEYASTTIGGTVFTDANGDGAQQASDAGLAGQTVELVSGGSVVATTTTAANGGYSFSGQAPGTYGVQVVAASGAVFSPVGTSASLPDSGVAASGASGSVTLSSGGSATFNAGEYVPGVVAGTVFNDANADGAKQAGDTGAAGVAVSLLNAAGAVIATTTSAANGGYSFTGIAPGMDTVAFGAPGGTLFSQPGTSPTLLDSTVASNGTQAVSIVSGSTATVNAGLYASGTISGLAFLDGNASGTYHVGDPGIAGVSVQLLTASGAATGISTTTNSSGDYSFAGLAVGSYEVKVLALPGLSYSSVEHASGNPLLDSDVNPAGGVSNAIVVTPGATVAQGNAGFTLNGNFTGASPINIGAGGVYTGNQGSGVIVGSGSDRVYTGSGGNNVVALGGGNNLVEAGAGSVNDIVTSAGGLNAQTQNDANGYLFGGVGNNLLQGGVGNTYLIGGVGTNDVFAGQGNNVLAGGVGGGSVTLTNGVVSGYTGSTYVVLGGASDTVLYQKGDGVLILNNSFSASKDSLQIYGYGGGTLTQVNGQTALYLGGNDMIVFNGQNSLASNGLAGVSFNANIAAAPQYSLSFGANGLPQIAAVGATQAVAHADDSFAVPDATLGTARPAFIGQSVAPAASLSHLGGDFMTDPGAFATHGVAAELLPATQTLAGVADDGASEPSHLGAAGGLYSLQPASHELAFVPSHEW